MSSVILGHKKYLALAVAATISISTFIAPAISAAEVEPAKQVPDQLPAKVEHLPKSKFTVRFIIP